MVAAVEVINLVLRVLRDWSGLDTACGSGQSSGIQAEPEGIDLWGIMAE